MSQLPPTPNRGVRAAGVPQSGLIVAQAALVVVAVLYFARELLVPLALSVLLAFVLAPVARALRRIGIPRIPGVLATVMAAVTVIGSLALVMGRQLAELANDIPLYQYELMRKLETLQASGSMMDRVREMLRGLAERAEQAEQAAAPARASATSAADQVMPLRVQVQAPTPGPFEVLQNVLEPLLYPMATFGIVIVLVVFILLYREDLRDRVIRLVGAHDLQRTMAAMDDAAYRLSRLFLAQTAMNAAYGVAIALALFLIGVPQPILWGILAGLMRFVPFVGTVVAVAFPLLLALAVDPGWGIPLMVLALFAFGEGMMGQVLEPWIFGQSTGLSPIAVIAAATFWTWLWGPIGLLLAVPLTVCLVVLGRHVERFEFLEVALGDRPPLDPPETFYQRALAGDGDGLAEQADMLLRQQRLSGYYDKVVLPALALAQADALRGSFAQERLDAVRDRIAGLVEDLEEDVKDDEPPERPLTEQQDADEPVAAQPPEALRAAGSVLCLAGRGPFDVGLAAMLAQVLRKRGFGAILAPADLLRGADMEGFAPNEVRQAWLCTMEGGSSAAAARYMLRRMRRRLPEAAVAALVPGGGQGRLPDALRGEGAVVVESDIAAVVQTAPRLQKVAAVAED